MYVCNLINISVHIHEYVCEWGKGIKGGGEEEETENPCPHPDIKLADFRVRLEDGEDAVEAGPVWCRVVWWLDRGAGGIDDAPAAARRDGVRGSALADANAVATPSAWKGTRVEAKGDRVADELYSTWRKMAYISLYFVHTYAQRSFKEYLYIYDIIFIRLYHLQIPIIVPLSYICKLAHLECKSDDNERGVAGLGAQKQEIEGPAVTFLPQSINIWSPDYQIRVWFMDDPLQLGQVSISYTDIESFQT